VRRAAASRLKSRCGGTDHGDSDNPETQHNESLTPT
jgi:hypothetical protein